MMSTKIGVASRTSRIKCGMISARGTGIGNRVNTGRNAVRIGIARSKLDR